MLLVKFEYKINDIVRLGRPTSQFFLPGPTAHCSWASTGLSFVSKAFIDKRQSLNSLIRVSSGPRRWACSELHVDYCEPAYIMPPCVNKIFISLPKLTCVQFKSAPSVLFSCLDRSVWRHRHDCVLMGLSEVLPLC